MDSLLSKLKSTLPPLLSGTDIKSYVDQDGATVRDNCIELLTLLDKLDVKFAEIIILSEDRHDVSDCINYLRKTMNNAVEQIPRRGTIVEVMRDSLSEKDV